MAHTKGKALTRPMKRNLHAHFSLFVSHLEYSYKNYDYIEYLVTNAKDYKVLRKVHRSKRECAKILAAAKVILESQHFKSFEGT